ncbi:MAG TPA: NAD-binding protein [Gaiellaceae bacterium]|nr:NAD-binding protein [Gaiellaceae bacterium]
MEEIFSFRRIVYAAAALLLVLLGGAIGYHAALDETWLQSVYRAVVTVSLTGLDSTPPNDSSRLLTIVLVLAGITIFAYIGSLVVEAIARGVLGDVWAERRRRRAIEALQDHYIICGFGRVGRRVAGEFQHEGAPFVVVDFSPEAKEAAAEGGVLFIEGNGTDDDDLRAAGLERARGLVAASDDDADNLYITLSARAQNDRLFIVARASTEDAAKKLQLAGADRVVQPYQAAGRVMASLLLRPQVTAFVDVVTSASGEDLRFEEIEVTTACGQGGRSIRDLDIRRQTGALIVALRKRDGSFDTTPTPEAVLDVGDVLIAAGTEEELRALERIFASRETVAG